ncbi:hypothetical protein [Staphylococcus gallinarum]|uniref:hypothetical protein n=1 Tax=Staphylococcus gallinarum TaxID=1293 RepID=UPI002DBDECA3|nr:hypothetical protein [Staphylococcus gallinarum]MEB7040057.1 hypothetical protein [Staphylococcus gallinarum]
MISYEKYDELDFYGFVLFADEVRTFDGKVYRIKGVRGQRIDKKRNDNLERHNLEHLSHIMYQAKTIKSDKHGLIGYRKKRYQQIKCVKQLTISA